MIPTEPMVADTGRYSVTQACEALGIHRNTLERYRKNNLIRCGKRRTSDRKYYTGFEIKKLWRML
jgi:DNA-binding transcriptional MerR regulator